MPNFQIGQRVRLLGDAEVVAVDGEGRWALQLASGDRVWVHPYGRDFEVRDGDSSATEYGIECGRSDGTRAVLPVGPEREAERRAASAAFRDRDPVKTRRRVDYGQWEVVFDV